MSKPIIPIVFATNNAYAPFASVTINSLIQNASEDYFYDIYVFHTELSEYNISILETMKGENYKVKCLCVERFIEREMKYMYTNFHFSKEMFYRILIPSILHQYDRAIYLDCDIVVLGDISEFYNIDLEGNIIAGANDIMHGVSKSYVTEELGIDTSKYINSGVLIIDSKAFRENNIKEKCFAELKVRTELRYPDQDIINLACAGKIKYLHRKWNYIWHYHIIRDNPSLNLPPEEQKQYLEDAKDIKILHYTSSIKPWKNKNAELSKYFWEYVEGCPFEAKIKKDYRDIPSKNYTVLQFMEENGDTLEFTASLYSLEGWTLDDLVLHIDGNESEIRRIREHTIEISSYVYRRFFFSFSVKTSELQDTAKIVIYNKNTGMPVQLRSAKTFPIDFNLNETCVMHNKAIYLVYRSLMLDTPTPELFETRKALHREALEKRKTDIAYKKSRILRMIYKIIKPFVRKELWLVSDRVSSAGDNGEAFFKYLAKKKPRGIRPIFVIDSNSPDYKRMKKYGWVISPYSKLYKIVFMLAKKNISSQLDPPIMAPINCARYLKDILNPCKIVFLQHGIIKDDLAACYNRCKDNMSIFITSAKREYDSIVSNPGYHCDERITKLTGLARYDLLEDKREKIIFIVPTWRKSCIEDMMTSQPIADVKNSKYFKFYNELLHSEKLISAARKHGYRLCFYPHPIMSKITPMFGKLDDIFLNPSDFTYTELFSKGALMLTDYSSTQFDFGYLKKPVVYTHFDRDEFFSSHTYIPGYFTYEDDGFGEVVYDFDSTVDILIEYMENGCELKDKYLDRINGFYAYTDKNNSQRIFDEIKKLK